MYRTRTFAFIATLGLTASALVAGVVPAGASPGAPTPPVGAAAPPTQSVPDDAEDCTLRENDRRSEHHEWGSCLAVNASLSAAPAIGQSATLTYEVTGAVARPDATVEIELPEGLTFDKAPAGATLQQGTQSDGTGSATRAVTTVDLAAGATARFSTAVRATTPGLKQITVTANALAPWGVDGAADQVFVTIGESGDASRLGGDVPTSGGVTPAPGTPQQRPAPEEPKIAPLTGEEQPHSDDETDGATGTDAQSCARGTWSYYDADGDLQPSINYQVQVWDQDSSTDDDLLATGVTSFAGTYDLCFEGADGEGGGQEVYVRFISSNSVWRVRNTAAQDDNYVNTTPVKNGCDGCVYDFGSLIPGNDIHRGMHAYDSANDFWVWLPHACWDRDGACRQAIINWTATSVDGTYYSLGSNDIHLAADDPNSPHTVVHELTHSTMDDAFDDDYPPIPNCSPHFIQSDSSTGCAWTEGFAEWVPAEVYNDPYYRWPSGAELNLETPTWGTAGWDSGDDVEGRVAGSLIDITDAANEVYWDRWDESDPGPVWDTFQSYVIDTFDVYVFARAVDGYNVSAGGALASIYQNTIDINFRDPLAPNVALARRAPTPNTHNYDLDTTTSDWSAVAVRPPAGANYNLSVYDDFAQGTLLKSSSYGAGLVDFVAVDSNHRALGDYYPRTTYSSGTGDYLIEHGANGGAIGLGTSTISMSSSDVVAVRDLALSAGATVGIRVVPANGGQDAAAFLMASTAGTSSTWVRSRSEAAATSTGGGAGVEERLTYAAPVADTYGFVLVNAAGSGTYTVHADTSAPTGSMLINDGATKTKKRAVTLHHLVSDPQTGLDEMRVSVDGIMDTEPWVDFSATSPATLPGGDGIKTVLTQYRNQAGLASGSLSDTIRLDRRPDLTTTAVSNPPKNRDRGDQFEVTDTVKNVGTNQSLPTITRYYLSRNKSLSAEDVVFAASRDVGKLDKGEESEGTTEVTVKGSTPLGKYYVLACADATEALSEFKENNNCKASKKQVRIQPADLVTPGILE